MVRRIIEDIKANKSEKRFSHTNEVVLRPKSIPKVVDIEEINENSKEEIKQELKREEEKESERNDYLKNKSKEKQRLQRTPQINVKPKILHKFTLVIFIFTIIAGGIYWSGSIFQKADITITSKHQTIIYNNKQFIASKVSSDNSVNFEIMITSNEEMKNIILTQSKDVSVKATGNITLYNGFSGTPVKLMAGTFVSDKDGKAYKIDKTVTIPGYKTDANKKIIPGQIDTGITSFLAGEAYNGSPVDFYITSYKGTTKYSKIYGKLKSPLVGGASGLVYILDDVVKSKIDVIAQSYVKDDLLRQVKALVPPGYILYPGALAFSYKIDDNFSSKVPTTQIPIDGSLAVVLLKEQSLLNNIIKVSLPNISGNELKEITISDLGNLSFSFTNKNQLISKDLNTVSFMLSGSINAVWNPDENILKTRLLGVNKNDVLSIFKQDPGISSAIVKIFPPWQKNIPKDFSKINIIEN